MKREAEEDWGRRRYEYPGARLHVLSPEQLAKVCPIYQGRFTVGCAYPLLKREECHIYLLTRYEMARRYADWDLILRHEMGHCSGWPVTHDGGRSLDQAPDDNTRCHRGTKEVPCSPDYDPNYASRR